MSKNYIGRAPSQVQFPDFATQAEMEAAAAVDKMVSPGQQKFHPGTAKAWANFSTLGGVLTIKSMYGISGIVRTGVGQCTVTFAAPFANVDYVPLGTGASVLCDFVVSGKLAASCQVRSVFASTGAFQEGEVAWIFFGDQ